MVMGGMVLETNMNEIVTQIDAQNKLEKSEVRVMHCVILELKIVVVVVVVRAVVVLVVVNACYIMLFALQ